MKPTHVLAGLGLLALTPFVLAGGGNGPTLGTGQPVAHVGGC